MQRGPPRRIGQRRPPQRRPLRSKKMVRKKVKIVKAGGLHSEGERLLEARRAVNEYIASIIGLPKRTQRRRPVSVMLVVKQGISKPADFGTTAPLPLSQLDPLSYIHPNAFDPSNAVDPRPLRYCPVNAARATPHELGLRRWALSAASGSIANRECCRRAIDRQLLVNCTCEASNNGTKRPPLSCRPFRHT